MADFVRVASTAEVPDGGMKKVMLGGQQVLLANVKGKFYAIGNVCTHVGGPLDKGRLDSHEVESRSREARSSSDRKRSIGSSEDLDYRLV